LKKVEIATPLNRFCPLTKQGLPITFDLSETDRCVIGPRKQEITSNRINRSCNLEKKISLTLNEPEDGSVVSITIRRKRPVRVGQIWTHSVAQYFIDIYPNLLDGDISMSEFYHYLKGEDESW